MQPIQRQVFAEQDFDRARDEIWDDLTKGLFTPFLGAGASSLRPALASLERYPWKQVTQTLTAICSRLEGESTSIRYLQSFAVQRLRMSKSDVGRYIPLTAKVEVSSELHERKLVDLQASLVRATVALTIYFGKKFAEDTPSLHNLRESWVIFSPEKKTADQALKALMECADLARSLRKSREESPYLRQMGPMKRRLDIERLYYKILTLILTLVGNKGKGHDWALAEHQRNFALLPRDIREANSGEPKLRLDAVQWLSDLLWYTLRYWVPRYPTTAELAFELSLSVQDAPVRRAELAQAAEALAGKLDVEPEIRELMQYCERFQENEQRLDREAGVFYYGIAAAMWHQFDLSNRTSASDLDLAAIFLAEEGEAIVEKTHPAIVFTTNFDRALECIYERENLPFHVVFPVRPHDSDMEDQPERSQPTAGIYWIFRTYHRYESQRTYTDKAWEEICSDERGPSRKFLGPVIVKLHGSPSEDLPDRPDRPVRHWIVLSEASYLQALSEKYGVPPWLKSQLHASVPGGTRRRSLWFLGYSLSDWNVRLRLYEHCLQASRSRSTVNVEADMYRVAFLRYLGVQQYLGDLNELPGMVLRVLDDDRARVSREVKMLVSRLKECMKE